MKTHQEEEFYKYAFGQKTQNYLKMKISTIRLLFIKLTVLVAMKWMQKRDG
jgi:hypothetical protein